MTFVFGVDRQVKAAQLLNERAYSRLKIGRGTINVHRHAHNEAIRLPLTDQCADGLEVGPVVAIGHNTDGARRFRDALANGDADAPQSKVKSNDGRRS